MKLGSLVERIELTDTAGDWLVSHRRGLSPVVWIAAMLAPLAIFWIGPLVLQDGAVRDARAVHAAWIETGRIEGARVMGPREFLTGLRQLGSPPHLPDLSANGLDMGRVSYVAPGDGGRGAIHVGYTNPAGCRITLWITPSAKAGAGALVEQHRTVAFAWHVDGLNYVIVRSGMHHERFHLIAKTSREMTIRRAALGGPRMLALALGGMTGRRCES
jgi:hypothetical protein